MDARERLESLYREHAPVVRNLAWRMTGDRMLAEDLVQEAFARLARRFPELKEPDAFGGYLRTTVANLARSHFRRVRVEKAYLERERRRPRPLPDDEGDIELRDALLRLPPRQRAVLALRYFEDLPVDQAARILGCPSGTVKSLASRAIGRLRRDLVPESVAS